MMYFRLLRRYAGAWLQDRRQFGRRQSPRECPICGFRGHFVAVGRPPRWGARCPNCDSRERHRLAHLYYEAAEIAPDKGLAILHFAPERHMVARMAGEPGYVTSDPKMAGMQLREDLTRLSLPDSSFDAVIAHHVLEHIEDDRQAMSELFRVLKPGGIAILSVPQNWSREDSFDNASIRSDRERTAAFGARDHKRLYGRDFADRLVGAGFQVDTFRVSQADEVRFGLLRDEVLYLARRPV